MNDYFIDKGILSAEMVPVPLSRTQHKYRIVQLCAGV